MQHRIQNEWYGSDSESHGRERKQQTYKIAIAPIANLRIGQDLENSAVGVVHPESDSQCRMWKLQQHHHRFFFVWVSNLQLHYSIVRLTTHSLSGSLMAQEVKSHGSSGSWTSMLVNITRWSSVAAEIVPEASPHSNTFSQSANTPSGSPPGVCHGLRYISFFSKFSLLFTRYISIPWGDTCDGCVRLISRRSDVVEKGVTSKDLLNR